LTRPAASVQAATGEGGFFRRQQLDKPGKNRGGAACAPPPQDERR